MNSKHLEIIPSSGNVFEDLGFKDSKQRLAKAILASHINDIIETRNFNQMETGEILGINQPKVSALRNGKLEGFSMERLITFLIKLDQDVKIVIKEKPKSRKDHGHLQVAFC
jgi:predicted XRE-type DNA-binding protein